MTAMRKALKSHSNNAENADKNICTLAVAKAFGVHDVTRYLHTRDDVVKALRTRYTVRSRMSSVKGKTVGAIRSELKDISAKVDGEVLGYYISVFHKGSGHSLALSSEGKTLVDTWPQKRDHRKFRKLMVIYK